MTLLGEKPTVSPTDIAPGLKRGRTASVRLAARLAHREVRRRRGRTVLVALMIAAPVMAMTFFSIAVRTELNKASHYRVTYGDTDLAASWDQGTSAWERAIETFPKGGEEAWVSDVPTRVLIDVTNLPTAHTSTNALEGESDQPGVATVTLILDNAQPVVEEHPVVRARVELLDGSWPGPGEALIPRDLRQEYGLDVGDELRLTIPKGTWRIAGVASDRSSEWPSPLLLDGVGSEHVAAHAARTTRTYKMPPETTVDEIRQLADDGDWQTWVKVPDPYGESSDGESYLMGFVFTLGTLGLFVTGIVVVAAFAVSGRRQMITIGQLSASGAAPKVVRRSLAFQGTWSGAFGAALGVFSGCCAWWISHRWLNTVIDAPSLPTQYRVGDFVVVVLVAVVVATAAAAAPSWSVAKTSTLAALAGRRPQASPARWLKTVGLGLTLGGLALAALATAAVSAAGSGLGLVCFVFGVLCVTPFVVEQLGRLGRYCPLSLRLALRAMARSQIQSAAVLAAITVTVGGAVFVNVLSESTAAVYAESYEFDQSTSSVAPADSERQPEPGFMFAETVDDSSTSPPQSEPTTTDQAVDNSNESEAIESEAANVESEAQSPRQPWTTRVISAIVVFLFVGFVVAVALSLAAAENRDELNTMIAVGASPQSLRRQAALRAITMVLAGTSLGVVSAGGGSWVLWQIVFDETLPWRLPWHLVLVLLVLVPAIIGCGAWIVAAVTIRRRPMVTPSSRW